MNRRELLKRLAAVPVIGAVVARAMPPSGDDGVALTSAPHPTAMEGDFETGNLRYVSRELTALQEINPDSLETVQLDVPGHEWNPGSAWCVHCRCTEEEVEDNLVSKACWSLVAARRTKSLCESMVQTNREFYDGPEPARILNEAFRR